MGSISCSESKRPSTYTWVECWPDFARSLPEDRMEAESPPVCTEPPPLPPPPWGVEENVMEGLHLYLEPSDDEMVEVDLWPKWRRPHRCPDPCIMSWVVPWTSCPGYDPGHDAWVVTFPKWMKSNEGLWCVQTYQHGITCNQDFFTCTLFCKATLF